VEGAALGAVHGGPMRDPPDLPTPEAGTWLEELLAPAVQRCGAKGTTLEVETSFHEVLDVRATSGEPAVRACMEEAAWTLKLSRRFTQALGRFALRLDAPQ
jgi:hypothetical protein